jgi:hypothetical protein
LIVLAQKLAEAIPDFLETKGPGAGDKATNEFMDRLRRNAKEMFGVDYSEARICGKNNFSIDFYFEDEKTAVEFAFSLDQPMNEYERDVFKCLLADDSGRPARKLVLVSKPGALARLAAPGPKSISDWVARKHALDIKILELCPPESFSSAQPL